MTLLILLPHAQNTYIIFMHLGCITTSKGMHMDRTIYIYQITMRILIVTCIFMNSGSHLPRTFVTKNNNFRQMYKLEAS